MNPASSSSSRSGAAAPSGGTPPIAIIGMNAVFPGALDVAAFWRDILEGRDRLSEVPRTHWLSTDYYDPRPGTPDKICTTRGGFLPTVDFSPMEFGLPPNVASATDTAQLLSLVIAKRVLLEATRGRLDSVDRNKVSVVLGVASATELVGHMSGRLQIPVTERAMRTAGLTEDEITRVSDVLKTCYVPWQENTFPGLLGNVVSGRIANRLDLGGTNTVVDAACASSLAAIDIGVNELALGRSDLVLTGGVDTLNDILMFMCFGQTGALSPTGDCRPFSDDADGTMLGEGIGIVALKRLADAERDGDAIYAVLRGIGTSSDGRAKSIYAPAPIGQAKALRRAYERAGYGPETVELVEAHGTATKAGDAAEVEALNVVFAEAGARAGSCALGSVKAQIGHTKASAGAAGLIKAVLALHHGVLPGTYKVRAPNTNLALEGSALYLNTETRPWVHREDSPRRASVSALGFGGTNFHVALEEYRGDAPRPARLRTCPTELVVFSGNDARGLAERCRAIAKTITAPGALVHLAKQSQLTFDPHAPARLAIVAADEAELCEKLRVAAETLEKGSGAPFSTPRGIHFGAGPSLGPVAVLFPGQGSQYVGMGKDLAIHFAEARRAWDHAAAVETGGDLRISDVVFPPPVFSDDARAAQEQRLTATEWAQPAIATTSLSMLRVLERLGLAADFAAGHSLGEVTALGAFGAIDRDAAVSVARRRGELVSRASETPGAMIALMTDLDAARGLVAAWGLDLAIANHNAPKQVVLSGALSTIEEAEGRLRAEGIEHRRLPVSTAFHSPLVASACAPFRTFLDGIKTAAPRVPVYSHRTGRPFPTDASAIRDEVARAVAEPVLFAEQIDAMYEAGARIFVEVGPSSVLTKLVGRCLADRPHVAVELDARGKNGVAALWDALGRLSVSGVSLAFAPLWENQALPQDPASAEKPKLVLKLTGANYEKPILAEAPVNVRPKSPSLPNGVTARAPAASAMTQTPATTMTRDGQMIREVHVTREAQVMHEAPATPVIRETHVMREAPVPPMHQGPALPSAIHASVIAAQMDYQRLMSESHIAFLHAVAGSYQGSVSVAHAPVVATTTTDRFDASATPAHIFAAAPMAPPPAPFAPPALAHADASQGPAPAPTRRAEDDAHATNDAATSLVRNGASANGRAPRVDLVALMLDVVADKTGYPAEMIELTMDLEADLGIDSIKRVEILSAVRSRAPGLPEVDTARMARMRTLQEIVAFLGGDGAGTDGAGADDATHATRGAKSPAVHNAAPSVQQSAGAHANGLAPRVDLVALMLDVVADKTGYPAEMIELTMDLEADLGIDSIKRVEILSAVRTRAPGLPEVDTARMARMRTLQEIVAFLSGDGGDGGGDRTAATHESSSAPSAKSPGAIASNGTKASAGANGTNAGANGAKASAGTNGRAPRVDLVALMLEVVADKTGYPAEMIELTMDLEADLGIDSIKRVEILSAVRTRAPGLPEVDTARMARMRTLQEIVAFLSGDGGDGGGAGGGASSGGGAGSGGGASSGGGATSSQQEGAAAKQRNGSTTSLSRGTKSAPAARIAARVVAAPPLGLAVHGMFGEGAEVIVTPDGGGVASALVERLRASGVSARLADVAPANASVVIFLGGLRPFTSIDDALAVNREAFAAARTVAARFREAGGAFVTVQDTGGDFGLEGRAGDRAWLAGLGALAKTAAEEWPLATARAIDIERGHRDDTLVAAAIADELLYGGPEIEVGLRADGARTSIITAPADALASGRPVPEGSVFVVSGGARGVTAECLVALARTAKPRFVLLGRSGLAEERAAFRNVEGDAALKRAALDEAKRTGTTVTPKELAQRVASIVANREVRATMRRLEEAGAKARYAAVDVRDGKALASILDDVRRTWGPIVGLVHGAGVLSDALIENKTDAQFDHVWDTKILGLRALLGATQSDSLGWLCLFSSVAARTGNAGQADYAMANEVMNKVAAAEARRRGDACRVVSIGWGPWDGGMVTPTLRKLFEARGVKLLAVDAGAEAFARELASKGDIEIGIGGDADLSLSSRRPRRVDVIVNEKTWPELASHRIKGNVVLPMAVALEWFARLVRPFALDTQALHFRELRVVRGVPLAAYASAKGEHFQVSALPAADGSNFTLELRDDRGSLRYSAILDLGPTPTTSSRSTDVALASSPWAPSEFYSPTTLFHGKHFQVLRSIEGMSSTHARAEISSTRDAGWAGDWHAEPAALDGALQLALLFGLHGGVGQSLPMRIERVIYKPGRGDTSLRCDLVKRSLTADCLRCDLSLTEEGGASVLDLQGVEMFVVPSGTAAS